MQLNDIVKFLKNQGIEVEVVGNTDIEISQVASLDLAKEGEISFLTDAKYLPFLESTNASVVILSPKNTGQYRFVQAVVDNPYYVYALVAQFLNPPPVLAKAIHASAVLSTSVKMGDRVSIGENSVIQDNCQIGEGSQISAGVILEEQVEIGQNCRIGSNVTICHHCILGDNVIIEAGTVIGGDGFGWANHSGKWIKIPQIGRVVIGNDVSIGNNVSIDRGAIEDTVIEDNCIIDNQVHIAHNVRIGSGSAIAGQAGFAGSTTLGKNCTVAGQVGFAGHIEISDNSHFLAKAGVTHNITESGAYAGFPAVKASEWQKNTVRVRQLDKLAKQIKLLQKQIDSLSS